ncbi:trypsin-like peptidase domain-containing protein [Patescibacteria group bacterium]|nr:trypsin-like peptidase domain-containing protein [Patescibacteria group bacterium]
MSDQPLPKFEIPKINLPQPKSGKTKRLFRLLILVILISSIFGFLAGIISGSYFYLGIKNYLQKLNIELPETKIIEKETVKEYIPQTSQEEAIVKVVENVSPAVVSVVVTKNIEEYYFTPFGEFPFEKRIEKKEIGGGTGFIVTSDGMILTNKHVVLDTEADYTVLTNDGRKFPAKVLAKDPVQDLAIIEVEGEKFPIVKLGDSSNLQIGQTVIAIGNALGEFQNTVSVGVISGLGRTITASGGGIIEILEDVIQTDAAINRGNSGGPLLNLKGEVIGINTAMSIEGENIGFAIPVNKAKRAIEQVKTLGKIVYPFLGIRYILITEKIQEENNLPVDYGAWVIRGDEPGESAIFPGSAAEKVGLKENDIVLEFNHEKITLENSLAKIIMKYNPGDEVVLKILREGKEKIFEVTLGERSE